MYRVFALRTYATRWPRPKPGTAERPPYRPPDPLINNPNATVTVLSDEDLTFVHRPPPTASSPQSFTTNPTSPLLRPKNEPKNSPLPPLIRPSAEKASPSRLSDENVAKLKQLRRSDPKKYSRTVLAKMFGCTQGFVSLVAALPKTQRKAMRKAREAEHQAIRDKWSQKHSLVKAIQVKKKEFW